MYIIERLAVHPGTTGRSDGEAKTGILQEDATYKMQEVEQKLLSFAKATSDETILHKLEKPFLPVISKIPERLVSQKWNPTIASVYCGLYTCLRFTISRDT